MSFRHSQKRVRFLFYPNPSHISLHFSHGFIYENGEKASDLRIGVVSTYDACDSHADELPGDSRLGDDDAAFFYSCSMCAHGVEQPMKNPK